MPRAAIPDPALAVALKRIREDRHITQEAVAFKAGLSVGTLGRIETGRTAPSWDSVRRIADALGVSLAVLGAEVEAHDTQ